MTRSTIIRPLRQALSRPLVQPSRNTLAGIVSARTQASFTNYVLNPREENEVRLPRAVQALYLQPLRREAQYGVPSCDLQLRSFSIPNLEFFCDFALRAAYYLNLPAFGPVPLPKIIERWTVPKSHFIFKKSQENFERVTRRRLIQIRDGHPETVQIWLAYLQKHAYYGIGMKANVWEFDSIGTGKKTDAQEKSLQEIVEQKMESFGRDKTLGTVEKVKELLASERQQRRNESTIASDVSPDVSPDVLTDLLADVSTDDSTDEQGEIANERKPRVIFSGIQPTGVPHLGNYLGALKPWKKLQDDAEPEDKLFFSVVDLHAITMPQDASSLRLRRREMLASLLAVGLDPDKGSTIFFQSSVPQHTELMWILSCTASMGYLGRMTQWKSKLQIKNKAVDLDEAAMKNLKLGLFSYPVLQAADILVHRATHVPVGDDQRQHLEFARECATNFNHTFKKILVPPETMTSPYPRIMSLSNPECKMSKSTPNWRSRISITAPPAEIRTRIKSAVTDNLGPVTYDPESRPGVSNLLRLLSQCSSSSSQEELRHLPPEELARQLEGASLKELKELVTEAVCGELRGMKERHSEFLNRKGGKWLDELEAEGAEVARRNAEETMRMVRDAVGLGLGPPPI
ncbi:hypothetical protein F5Y00DRAFT_252803 [Daldinia vernicosa]|uniref:uncharacterized protein n=1 Tax=Daldinia vernicosa TaxID=114800 RepID=UPI002008CE70|nr:uncharacterized protein F5Y00DRAFT_252803 [Daldinia vernicosa]KAI0849348.1 hypothetical protein F5Y00DRAFT_252803 [Daldinia vernicosa]